MHHHLLQCLGPCVAIRKAAIANRRCHQYKKTYAHVRSNSKHVMLCHRVLIALLREHSSSTVSRQLTLALVALLAFLTLLACGLCTSIGRGGGGSCSTAGCCSRRQALLDGSATS